MSKRFKIEFDSINELLKAWVDGKRIDDLPVHGLQEVHLDWNTNTDTPKPGEFYMKWFTKNPNGEVEENEIHQTPVNGGRSEIEASGDDTDTLTQMLNDLFNNENDD